MSDDTKVPEENEDAVTEDTTSSTGDDRSEAATVMVDAMTDDNESASAEVEAAEQTPSGASQSDATTIVPAMSDASSTKHAVDEAHRDLEIIARQRKVLKWVRIALPITLITLVCIGLATMYATAENNLVKRKEDLAMQFQNRSTGLWPKLEREARVVANNVLPEIRKRFIAAHSAAQRSLPAVLDKNTRGMEKRVEGKMTRQLAQALEQVAQAQRAKLTATFPDLFKCTPTDEPAICKQKQAALDALMVEIAKSYHTWAITEMRTTFAGHITAMDNIRKTMNRFAANEQVASGHSATANAPGDMIMVWLELVSEAMGDANDMFEDPSSAASSTKEVTK